MLTTAILYSFTLSLLPPNQPWEWPTKKQGALNFWGMLSTNTKIHVGEQFNIGFWVKDKSKRGKHPKVGRTQEDPSVVIQNSQRLGSGSIRLSLLASQPSKDHFRCDWACI